MFGGKGGGGGGCAVRGIACQRCRTGGQRREGAECELLPSPFYALHRLCPLALRSRAGRLLSLWLFVLRKNTALSRGWCTPLTRGSAVCGAKRIAQHANPGLLSSPVRLSAFPQNVIKRNQVQRPRASHGPRRAAGRKSHAARSEIRHRHHSASRATSRC